MKKLLAILLAALLAVFAAACGQTAPPQPEQSGTGATADTQSTLNLHLGGEPDTIDPAFATAENGGSYVLHLFEGLTAMDKTLEPVAAAAEKWEVTQSKDGLPVYTFTLRQDAVWSDGTPVTAQDFVFAWLRALDPETKSPTAYQLFAIKNAQGINQGVEKKLEDGKTVVEYSVPAKDFGAVAKEDGTLEVTLEGPCPYFLQLLTLPVYAPVRKDVVTGNPDTWTQSPATCIGNGLYMLKEWNHDKNLSMVLNDLHRDSKKAQNTFLNFVLSQDSDALYADLAAGRLQLTTGVPLPVGGEKESFVPQAEAVPRMGSYYYLFNTAKAPLDKAEVRRAISLALDRQALVDTLEGGAEATGPATRTPALGLVPYGVTDTDTGTDFRDAGEELISTDAQGNLDAAKELLAQAGYPGGAGLPTLRFITNNTPAHLAAANLVKEQLATRLGVQLEVVSLSTQDFQTAKAGEDWDLARGGLMGYVLDPYIFLDSWGVDSSANPGRFTSEAYDTLLAAALTAEPKAATVENAPSSSSSQSAASGASSASSTPASSAGSSAASGSSAPAQDSGETVIPDSRMKVLHNMEKLLVSERAAVLPLWFYNDPVLMAPGLSQVVFSPLGYRYFQWAQLQS